MGGLIGATIAEADKNSSNAVVYKVGMARMMETIRKLDERDADYAVLRAIESTRRGSAVQFVVESDGVPPYREIVKDQEPEDIGRVPVAVVRRAQQKWADARSATDDQAMFVHMIDALKLPGNKNFDFAGAGATGAPSASRSSTVCDVFASHADDYWAAGKLELRYTYQSHGVSLALEKAIVTGYVAKSVESGDLVPYDNKEEIARARRPRRGASLSATDAGSRHDLRAHRQRPGRRHEDPAGLGAIWLRNRLRPHRLHR